MVTVTQYPTGSRKNVLRHGLSDEVKKIGKDVMETWSGEYSFIAIGLNTKIFGLRRLLVG